MTQIKQPRLAAAGLLLAIALVVTLPANMFSAMSKALAKGMNTGGTSSDLHAAVTIKTQEAADNIENGIKGIDVSEYQGSINWDQVKENGINFALIRASVGTTSDKTFRQNAKNAHQAGVLVGAYHYATFTSTSTAVEQAEFFLSHLDGLDITYPVVLDLENNRGNLSKAKLTQAAKAFMETVKDAGYTVMLYSYENYFHSYLDMSKLQDYPIWAANYIQQPSQVDHKIWQHTSYGSVSGISGRVDINIAYEDLRLRKKIVVDKEKSDLVKQYLNTTYKSQLAMDQLVMADVKQALVKGFQTELNALLNAKLAVDGELYSGAVQTLEEMVWSEKYNTPKMISLMQSALFYKGLYPYQLTGVMDDNTIQAVKDFQKNNGLDQTGNVDCWELELLFQ
ncbi:GH25 family lysozyme [Oscillospiraceae bacterium MB08-C2-2]|nr:GH25 family lysozyme [Oscillospiraceae bacterium MB08-C2-2]